MDENYRKLAIQLVLEMTPQDGACGVDVDSDAYQDMLDEYVYETEWDKEKLDEHVKILFRQIWLNGGFSCLNTEE